MGSRHGHTAGMKRLLIPALGALGFGAVLLSLLVQPPSPPPPRPAEPVAALPLRLPPAPGNGASSSAAGPTPGLTAAAPATPRSTSPTVGSEGYGPHIERAAAGNDPAAAWEAVQWLRQCADQPAERESAETLRNRGVAPEFMTQRMAELDAVERRCQTVTAAHRGLVPQLAALAVQAGVPGAAAVYVDSGLPRDLSPAQQRGVLEALRRDAQNGHAPSLWAATLAPPEWGLSDEERLRYALASSLERSKPVDLAAARRIAYEAGLGRQVRLTDAQLAAGLQSAREMLQRAGFPVPQ